MRFLIFFFISLALVQGVYGQERHEFFPSGYALKPLDNKTYHISPYLTDGINICIHASNRNMQLMNKGESGFETCSSIANVGGEFICELGVTFEVLVYKTSFGYCTVGMGFVGGQNKVLLFAYPSRHPIVVNIDANIIRVVWLDDFNTNLQFAPSLVTINWYWDEKVRQLRVSQPVFYDSLTYELIISIEKIKACYTSRLFDLRVIK